MYVTSGTGIPSRVHYHMADLAILPRCSAAELREVGFSVAAAAAAAAARRDTTLALPVTHKKTLLNGNFAALGDNWAFRRHVIIPATAAGALLKLLEFMDSAGWRRAREERSELFSFREQRLWRSLSRRIPSPPFSSRVSL